jgi:hypothetical protein
MRMDEYRLRAKVIGEYLAGKELVNRINELETAGQRVVDICTSGNPMEFLHNLSEAVNELRIVLHTD